MKNYIRNIIFLLSIALFFSLVGCSSVKTKIDSLSLGMTTHEVNKALDKSDYTIVEKRSDPDGEVVVRRYGTYADAWDLTLKNGKLTGWKQAPYDEYRYGSGVRFGVGLQHIIIRD